MTYRPTAARAMRLLSCALVTGVALAGCSEGAAPTTTSTSTTPAVTTTTGAHATPAPSGQPEPPAKPTTLEEKREYDENEGRCEDDGGTVRNVGTMAAYCSFPKRSDDFHLIETAQQKEPLGEEE